MELEHRFELPVGLDKAFPALLDLNVIGPCFPGATVDSVNGDEFAGSVKVKIGPVPLNYKGTARFVEKDFDKHTAVIEANGSAPRSGSTATMLVNAAATAVTPNRTAIVLVTTLSITGRAASFTRQAMIDVGNELIGTFADGVSNKLTGKSAGGAELLGVSNPDQVAAAVNADEFETEYTPEPAARVTVTSSPHARQATARSAKPATEPIQVLKAVKKPNIKELLPVIGGVVLAILILFRKGKSDTEKVVEKSAKSAAKAAKRAATQVEKSAKKQQKDQLKSVQNAAATAAVIADAFASAKRK